MTDISGNFGVNAHSYNKNDVIREQSAKDCCRHNEEEGKREIDLDKNPASVLGKSMIVDKKGGKYQFDAKKVEDDVKNFQENFSVAFSVASDYKNELIKKGVKPDVAQERAAQFMACLLASKSA